VGAGPVFYRSLEADSIFSESSVVEFSLSGPLQQHFALALAGMPDGIFPPERPKPCFDGVLTLSGRDVPVTIRVRGNSSLQECPFPKLKFKVSRADRGDTPFFDAREIKIGTHCAEGGRGSIGRLCEEAATFREALAYEVMERLGFVSPGCAGRGSGTSTPPGPVSFPDKGNWSHWCRERSLTRWAGQTACVISRRFTRAGPVRRVNSDPGSRDGTGARVLRFFLPTVFGLLTVAP
jgi:hypothetical protein